MPINYDQLMSLKSTGERFAYTDRETMLYAIGVGMGRAPLDEKELDYVFENNLKTIPTMATVIAWGAGNMGESGINFMMVVHGEQRLTMHRPLPPAAEILADSRVVGAFDKGEGKGALIVTETDIKLAKSGDKLCTIGSTVFARGDGGFGGPAQGAPQPHQIPDRPADQTIEVATRDDQAILYRLSGDRNPLHISPEFAKMAGFDKPILHGLCSYGTAARGILTQICDYDHAKIKRFDVRFSAPVFPGETLVLDVWKDGTTISFTARVKQREIVALSNGLCELAGA